MIYLGFYLITSSFVDVLPVEGGGTGVGTIEEARQVLSVVSLKIYWMHQIVQSVVSFLEI